MGSYRSFNAGGALIAWALLPLVTLSSVIFEIIPDYLFFKACPSPIDTQHFTNQLDLSGMFYVSLIHASILNCLLYIAISLPPER